MEGTYTLQDAHGRVFPYLRLSVTDVCNYRCTYCLPDGYKKEGAPSFLRADEIRRLVTAFANMGTWKVRLTGGEPTIRDDFLEIAKTVSRVAGIKKCALTTNGYKLTERAFSYRQAGISAINISIDSLRRENFKKITGHDRLQETLDGITACQDAGFESIKVNAVLLKNTAETELADFIAFAHTNPVSIRFIELMRTNDNAAFFKNNHISAAVLQEILLQQGWYLQSRQDGAGPALEFAHKNALGTIGVIAPYAKDFCASCNRLRISARGDLHLCLFGQKGVSLRDLLQCDDQIPDLQSCVQDLLRFKSQSHALHQNSSGTTKHLASIGG